MLHLSKNINYIKMELELSNGTIAISAEIISYFKVLQCVFEDNPEICKLPFESVSVETFTNLLKWLHGEEVVIDDDMINLVIFLNMIEPHKTRFCAEITDYLLEEPRLLPRDFYINLLKVDPGRLFLFVEKYFSDEEKAYFRTFMTLPEDLGKDDEYNGKIIVYDRTGNREIIDDFAIASPIVYYYFSIVFVVFAEIFW